MGHSNPSITLRVYSHWFKDTDTASVTAVTAGFLKAAAVLTRYSLPDDLKPRKANEYGVK